MENKICLADTRNQIDDFVIEEIKKLGYEVKRMTLPFGDFAFLDNLTYCVDIKSSSGGIVEIAKNICSSDHDRLRREIKKCFEWNGEICFLIANEDGIEKLEDLITWKVPHFKSDMWSYKYLYNGKWISKKQLVTYINEKDISSVQKKRFKIHSKGDIVTLIKPEILMKAIKTMSEPNHYKDGLTVRFAFCSKESAGEKIIQILEYWQKKHKKLS